MDKRWIGILLILIAGLVCMYYIVDNSTTVGNAISVINDVTIPVPQEMKISVSNRNDVTFLNENTNESIYINCVDKNPEKAFDKYIFSSPPFLLPFTYHGIFGRVFLTENEVQK